MEVNALFYKIQQPLSDNTANGNDALYYNTTGYDNTANGSGALGSNTSGIL